MFQLRLNLTPRPCLHGLARVWTLNQRLPVITQLSSRRSANCASLPSPQAPRDKHCGQPPCGLLPVKYKKPLFEFNRKNQNEKGHALRDLFRFGLIVQNCNSTICTAYLLFLAHCTCSLNK